MMSEEHIIIAFVFKRSGKKELDESNIYLSLSVGLNWFKPNEAKSFVKTAIQKNLLIKKRDMLTPSFDFENVEIPLGFQPSKQKFDFKPEKTVEKEISPFENLVKKIVEKSGKKEKDIVKKIDEMSEEKNTNRELSLLLLAKEYNVDFSSFIDDVEATIFT